jgi:rubrerythrin
MDREKLIERLNDILHLEYDAVNAYITSIKNTENEVIVGKFTEFLTDHNRHVARLTERVRAEGGNPANKPDVKGFFIKGMTAVMSKLGDTNSLRAMLQNEMLTNSTYDKAVAEDFPADVHQLMLDFQGDERRHRSAIEQLLEEWKEHAEHKAPPPEQPGAQP